MTLTEALHRLVRSLAAKATREAFKAQLAAHNAKAADGGAPYVP
jgi:hypothetical protein